MKIIKRYFGEDHWQESSIEDCIKFAPYDKESIVEILSDYMIVRSSFAEWKNATKIGFIKEISNNEE